MFANPYVLLGQRRSLLVGDPECRIFRVTEFAIWGSGAPPLFVRSLDSHPLKILQAPA